uniref:Uncharacterized protein n=1 Tax=Kuenenia stuttgartiensis TaxID=174633 RepID=Q1Q0Z1_KUEST|nr:unknown protein [Candidatus Kuenenia stuttgartiensis]
MYLLFQFLIGRMKTLTLCISFNLSSMFQFLIGRMKTRIYFRIRPGETTFQFLIGRMKTNPFILQRAFIILVSIPHR